MPGRRPPKAVPNAKRERKASPLDVKLEVLRRFEAGERLSQIAKALDLAVSTVATIRDNKEKITVSSQVATPSRAARLTRPRSAAMETGAAAAPVAARPEPAEPAAGVAMIQEEAKSLFDDLQRERGESSQKEAFSASKGWLVRFKEHHRLPHFQMNGTAASNRNTCREALESTIEEGEYTPQQVFNVHEIGLYWKRMPEGTFISVEEKAQPGFHSSRDRLMLLLGGNAAGT